MSNKGKTHELTKTEVLSGDQSTFIKEVEKAKEQDACIIVIRGNPQGHRYFLNQPLMTLGRDPSADIVISDQSISRKHIQFTKSDAKVYVTDLASSNGTSVNNKKIIANEPYELTKEDMIKLGNVILKFLPAGEFEILFYGNLGLAAHTDALTQIYNKGYLLEAIEAEFKRAKALQTDFSVLFFDLDFFKKINDQFGHAAGDLVLKEFAHLVRTKYLRPKDVFARYGGEEFVVLLNGTSLSDAEALAEKIRQGVQSHSFEYEGKKLPVTTSLGVAELTAEIESAQTLLKQADQALYKAKSQGRNCVVCFH